MKEVFISYSRKNTKQKKELVKHLTILKRKRLIRSWDDSKIEIGGNWEEIIKSKLEKADIFILMVSSDFLASDFIFNIEQKRAIERYNEKKAKIYLVIVNHCLWEETELKNLEALPIDEFGRIKPISKWVDKNEAYYTVSRAIYIQIKQDSKPEQQFINNNENDKTFSSYKEYRKELSPWGKGCFYLIIPIVAIIFVLSFYYVSNLSSRITKNPIVNFSFDNDLENKSSLKINTELIGDSIPKFVEGKNGEGKKALFFDGHTLLKVTSKNFASQLIKETNHKFSISLWIKADTTQKNQTCILSFSKKNNLHRKYNWELLSQIQDNSITINDNYRFNYLFSYVNNDYTNTINTPFNFFFSGTGWNKISIIINGQNIKYHVNGILQNEETLEYNFFEFNSNNDEYFTLTIGGKTNQPKFFKGAIDNFKIYNTSFTNQEVLKMYQKDKSSR